MDSKIVTELKKVEDSFNVITRRDVTGYASEVNSCDSGDLHEEANEDYKQLFTSLQHELDKTKLDLVQKSVECKELQNIRNKVEAELEDLTTSLFEEANKMVYDANLKRHKIEKKLAAAEGKIEALQTEVCALKSLVITSTPSNPNPKSHPQLIKRKEASPIRTRHHGNIIPVEKSKVNDESASVGTQEFKVSCGSSPSVIKLSKEVDKFLLGELTEWHRTFILSSVDNNNASSGYCDCLRIKSDDLPSSFLTLKECEMMSQSPFMTRVYCEDIALCLSFQNEELSRKISQCVHTNSLSVELSAGNESIRKCSLSGILTCCKHRIRLDDSDNWFDISRSCRNRITTVCDFLTYLRYIKQGIVKHNVEQVYWEIIRLRMEMTFARLGYYREQI